MEEKLKSIQKQAKEAKDAVVDAVKAAGLEVLEVTYQGEWVSVTSRRK